jgi:ubiquinone biosynthesis protein Coq4
MSDDVKPQHSAEDNEVTDLNQFITLLASWHSKRVKRLEEILQTPEGTEVSMGDAPPFTLSGDALKGFQIGVSLSLSQLGRLPFEAEFEDPSDGVVQ